MAQKPATNGMPPSDSRKTGIASASPLAVAANNQEGNLGEWYLDRFGKPSLALGPIVAESFRNSGVSTNVNFLYIICSNS